MADGLSIHVIEVILFI